MAAPAQAPDGGTRVWNVTRQCWQAPDAQTCGQGYDVGKRRHTGEGEARPAPRIETAGAKSGDGESGDGATQNPDAQVEILDKVRKQLEKLDDTAGKTRVLRSLGELRADDGEPAAGDDSAGGESNGDATTPADTAETPPDEKIRELQRDSADPGAPTPLEKGTK